MSEDACMDETERRRLDADVAGCASSHQSLLASLDAIVGDDVITSDVLSSLPGWTVGHVLTHLARNSDAFRHMIEGAAAGEVRPMYATALTRDLDIAAGASRPLSEIVSDVRRSVWALESAWATLGAEGWAGFGLTRHGNVAVTEFPWRRRREVEVHRMDLGLGYTVEQWPVDYVETDLARSLADYAEDGPEVPGEVASAPPARRLAWLLGRQSGFASPPPTF